MIEGGVDEDAVVVPSAALDADGLVDGAQLFQLLVGKDDVLTP